MGVERVQPALKAQRRPGPDIAFEHLAIVPYRGDGVVGPGFVEPQRFAEPRGHAEQALDRGIVAGAHVLDIGARYPAFLRLDERGHDPAHHVRPFVVAVPGGRRQRLLGDAIGEDRIVVRVAGDGARRREARGVAGERIAAPREKRAPELVETLEHHRLERNPVAPEEVREIELGRRAGLHAHARAVELHRRCHAQFGGHKERLAVIEDDRTEIETHRSVARERDGGVAAEHIHLARLQGDETLLGAERTVGHGVGVAEHRGGDGAADIDIEARPVPLRVREGKARQPGAHSTGKVAAGLHRVQCVARLRRARRQKRRRDRSPRYACLHLPCRLSCDPPYHDAVAHDKAGWHIEAMNRETLTVLAGRDPAANSGIVNPPVYHASTVTFPTLAALEQAEKRKLDTTYYGRNGTPTTFAFEEAVAALEGGHRTVALASGKAAVLAALTAFVDSGDHLLVTDSAYGPTRACCERFLSRFGVETTFYDPAVGAGIAGLIRSNTRLVFVESPGSLTFEVQDVPAIAEAAHAAGCVVAMDSTWASPLFVQPFALGVDVSIQAATKYIAGHSDLMLGAVTATEALQERVRKAAFELGAPAGPDDLYLAQRGLRTLGARMPRHMESGLAVAEWLRGRPQVARVLQPGLPGDPGHALWRRDFSGASGLFGGRARPWPPARRRRSSRWS